MPRTFSLFPFFFFTLITEWLSWIFLLSTTKDSLRKHKIFSPVNSEIQWKLKIAFSCGNTHSLTFHNFSIPNNFKCIKNITLQCNIVTKYCCKAYSSCKITYLGEKEIKPSLKIILSRIYLEQHAFHTVLEPYYQLPLFALNSKWTFLTLEDDTELSSKVFTDTRWTFLCWPQKSLKLRHFHVLDWWQWKQYLNTHEDSRRLENWTSSHAGF